MDEWPRLEPRGRAARNQLADTNPGREEELENDVVADGTEIAVAAAGGLIPHRRQFLDLLFRRGEQRTHFAR